MSCPTREHLVKDTYLWSNVLHTYRVGNTIQQLILTGIQYACELNIDC